MTRKALISLLIIAAVFILIQIFLRPVLRSSPLINQSIALLYLWIPGIIALTFVRHEKFKLPIFARPNRFFFSIFPITMGICLVAFVLTIPFGITKTVNPFLVDRSIISAIGYAIVFLFTSYLFATVILTMIFLGGELFYRGYLWEKWKGKGALKAIWLIALVWSLYQLPVTIFSYSPGFSRFLLNIVWIFLLNFILSPVLTYCRIKGKSILSAAVFYASLMSAFLYFIILFPVMEMKILSIYALFSLAGVIAFSFFQRLYFSKTWERLE